MSGMRRWVMRLVGRVEVLFRKGRVETELDAEVQFHIEREIRENIRRGLSPTEARRKALVDFGGIERTKEEVRDVRGARSLDDLGQDVRFAWRSFSRRPGFSFAAVALMALGIGSTTTIFSVVKAVLLEPLPYPESERLVFVDGLVPAAAAARACSCLTCGHGLLCEGDPEAVGGETSTDPRPRERLPLAVVGEPWRLFGLSRQRGSQGKKEDEAGRGGSFHHTSLQERYQSKMKKKKSGEV